VEKRGKKAHLIFCQKTALSLMELIYIKIIKLDCYLYRIHQVVSANFSGTYKVIIPYFIMLLPAEIESKTLIPALRAILAKNLSENHNVREDEISKMLGVTQAAISNYIRGTRGDPELIKKLSAEKQVSEMINEISSDLSSDMAYSPSSLSKFIGLCNYIKTSLLICDIHHNLESDIDEAICKECENMLLKGPGSVY
jgi:predicted transcriptional regulator